MIEVYGWKIEENGEPGKGVKFTIVIPKINKYGKENYQITPLSLQYIKKLVLHFLPWHF